MSYIGIDLGTTNCCVALWRNGGVEVIANDLGGRTTPSWVAFTEEERILGQPAITQFIRNPKNTIFEVKRLMGRRFNDKEVQEDIQRWPFAVVDVDGKPRIQVEYKKEVKTFAPEEISAMLLEKMKTVAESFIGGNVKGAVITVPAYFNDAQRQATLDAGEIAGLNVLGLINEPTAAALAYGLNNEQVGTKKVLIYDLGGGTFDVSIVSIQPGPIFKVLASTGDTHLGGGDFDELLVKHLAEEFQDKKGISVYDTDSKRPLGKLKLKAQEVKELLSTQMAEKIFIDSLCGGEDFETKVTQPTFEYMCSGLVSSTLVHVQKAFDDAKMKKNKIEEVVLVGGSTRIPLVQKLLQEFFTGKSVNKTVNPDEAVAYGAAVQAAILSGDSDIKLKNLVSDITALSLGVDVKGDVTSIVVPRNTRIPCNISETFSTSADNQTSIQFIILEGERTLTKDNHILGSFTLTGVPPAPAEAGKALVTFDLNNNAILRVTAVEKVTGKSESITIQMKEKGLSPEEIERMKADAEKYREEDELQRRLVETKNELERLRLRKDFNYL